MHLLYQDDDYHNVKMMPIFGMAKTPTFFQQTLHIYFWRYKLPFFTAHRKMIVLGDWTPDFLNFVRVMIYGILKFQIWNLSLRAHKSSPGQNFKNLEFNHLEHLYFYTQLKFPVWILRNKCMVSVEKMIVSAFPNMANHFKYA